MQESQVGWDPISINHQLPRQEKLFCLYLLVVLAVSVFRAVSLARQVWFSGSLAKANFADDRFRFAWEMCTAKVVGMKNLAMLTLILSALVPSYSLMQHFNAFAFSIVTIVKPSGFDLAGGPAALFIPVVLGLSVSAVVYTLSSLFVDVLARRRAEWDLFITKVSNLNKLD